MADRINEAAQLASAIRAALRTTNARRVLELLVSRHGFTWANDRDPQRLRGFGITATCTSGPLGLLMNWIAAVERRAEKINAGEGQ